MAEGMDTAGEINITDIKVIHVKPDNEFPFPYSTTLAAPEWPLAALLHVPTVRQTACMMRMDPYVGPLSGIQ